ncbi:MAG: response regulator [Alphaproteobacteria bacterium]|nr:response regulator [Alphaproteobacteria bacterium]
MDVIASSERLKFLEYTTRLKYQLAEWLIVEVKIKDASPQDMSNIDVAELMHTLFKDHDGVVMPCKSTEILMLISWGKDNNPQKLVHEMKAHLPAKACDVTVVPPTKEGMKKLVLMIAPPDPKDGPLYAARLARDGNLFLIADDDMYIRTLAKAGLKPFGDVIEVSDGSGVVESYKQNNPDMVLLDIHLPGLGGQEILNQLRAIDPKAYVIMLSADSSLENVKLTHQHGAKGFLAKPIHKAKLQEYIDACPTLT